MRLRTRIAVTFLALVSATLAAALGAVSIANRDNAEREVQRQLDVGARVFLRALESNRRQLAQAAQAAAADYAVRQAVSQGDTDTLDSVLENSRERIGAAMAILTSLDGRVVADSGSDSRIGTAFQFRQLLRLRQAVDADPGVVVAHGHIYQLVAAAVRSPLPVAWIVMGFELDTRSTNELAQLTGLGITLSVESPAGWSDAVTTAGTRGRDAADLATRSIDLGGQSGNRVTATLSRSLAEARAPFERLTRVLFLIAFASLVVAGFAIFALARNITQPLRALAGAVDRIRSGTYDASIPVQRHDELGLLAEGLQVMQSAVRSRDSAIRRLAYEDTLTGIMNRAAFTAALDAALTTGTRPIGVAVLNLHRFRRVNEHLGFGVGDAVLTRIAERLRADRDAGVTVARLAGDEFAAFATLEEGSQLRPWGAALLARLSDPVIVDQQPIDVSMTLGLSIAPVDAVTADELLRCAELSLERARREKQPLLAYTPALQPTARDQLSLLGELQRAVDADELRLFFQPKIELATGRVAGAEVLLRWQHPVRGLLGPGLFLPFAEQTGFIRRITRWTLGQAAAQCAAWYRGGRPLQLAVNVSADDLGDLQFDRWVARELLRQHLPANLLTLEITESGFIEDPEQALRLLAALAAVGVSLSIDDFGTGYSSLSHLARMPVHELKIDRSFVLGLERDPEYAAIVRAAIDMGHSLGMKVVAEGIETETAEGALRALGCDIVQGYRYAKPMPLAEFEAWLEGRLRVPVVALPATASPEDLVATAVFETS
jgi:diguanylate cyclase (GGDEF)-like protein